jgi:hypothetical protein
MTDSEPEIYEYVAVDLGKVRQKEQEITARLNEVAQHGWRIVAVIDREPKWAVPAFAIFERPSRG